MKYLNLYETLYGGSTRQGKRKAEAEDNSTDGQRTSSRLTINTCLQPTNIIDGILIEANIPNYFLNILVSPPPPPPPPQLQPQIDDDDDDDDDDMAFENFIRRETPPPEQTAEEIENARLARLARLATIRYNFKMYTGCITLDDQVNRIPKHDGVHILNTNYFCMKIKSLLNIHLNIYQSEHIRLTELNNLYRINIIDLNQILSDIYLNYREYNILNNTSRDVNLFNVLQGNTRFGNEPITLQPKLRDLFLYHLFYLYFNIDYDIPTRWDKYVIIMRDIIKVDVMVHLTNRITRDLDNRSTYITNKIINNTDIRSCKLMDGHGRIIYRIVNNLLTRDRNINIMVYDTDLNTHIWHQETIPTNIDGTASCYNSDILDDLENAIRDNILVNTIYYLNFCGIGNVNLNRLRGILDMLNDNVDTQPLLNNIIISFSVVRGALDLTNDFINTYLPGLNFNTIPFSGRGDFVTVGRG